MKLMERTDYFRNYAADLTEHEVLSNILQFTNIRKDKEIVAANLLDTFGSLKNVLEARPEMLMKVDGVGEKTACHIASFLPVVHTWERLQMKDKRKIGNARDAKNYCLSLLSGSRIEKFFVICLDAKCNLIGARKISDGSLSECSAYPRMVVEAALNYNAHAVILSHNHPGGTLAPSSEDIASTLQIQKILNGIGIMVYDHVIVANNDCYSMIEHGDIDYRVRR